MKPKKDIPAKPSQTRRIVSISLSLIIAVIFSITAALIVEARNTSFYGEPLFGKMKSVASIHLHGLPENPEQQARIRSGIPNLNLLPPQAVLPADEAARFNRLGISFAYVLENVRPGNGTYQCRATDLGLVPPNATSIAIALSAIPDDVLQSLHLRYIVFCGDLLQGHKKVGGFPVPVDDLIILNLTNRTIDGNIRDFFMHEFYHLFEARLGITNDPNWNKQFGGYKNSYAGNAGPQNNSIGSGDPGFMNHYSESFAYEERAELFAKLMTARPRLLEHIASRNDKVLYSKASYVADTARILMHVQMEPF